MLVLSPQMMNAFFFLFPLRLLNYFYLALWAFLLLLSYSLPSPAERLCGFLAAGHVQPTTTLHICGSLYANVLGSADDCLDKVWPLDGLQNSAFRDILMLCIM